jgi:hypothetical protein
MITQRVVGGLAGLEELGALGAPALIGAILVVVIVVGALCWVLTDTERAERLALLIEVTRSGDDRNLRSSKNGPSPAKPPRPTA